MTTKVEIERKFLVKFPSSWSQLSELFDGLIDVKRISQSYLKAEGKNPSGRVRRTIQGLVGEEYIVFHYNEKKPSGHVSHEETEYEISKKQYEKMLEKALPDKVAVEKTRFVFDYNDQEFELDVFKGPLSGLAILEIELKNSNDTVELPKFLEIVKEVTADKRYSNFSLADKKLLKELVEQ